MNNSTAELIEYGGLRLTVAIHKLMFPIFDKETEPEKWKKELTGKITKMYHCFLQVTQSYNILWARLTQCGFPAQQMKTRSNVYPPQNS